MAEQSLSLKLSAKQKRKVTNEIEGKEGEREANPSRSNEQMHATAF